MGAKLRGLRASITTGNRVLRNLSCCRPASCENVPGVASSERLFRHHSGGNSQRQSHICLLAFGQRQANGWPKAKRHRMPRFCRQVRFLRCLCCPSIIFMCAPSDRGGICSDKKKADAGWTLVEAVLYGTFTCAARTHTRAPARTHTPGVEAERRVRPQASLWRDHPRRCPRTDLRGRGWLPRERPAIES